MENKELKEMIKESPTIQEMGDLDYWLDIVDSMSDKQKQRLLLMLQREKTNL